MADTKKRDVTISVSEGIIGVALKHSEEVGRPPQHPLLGFSKLEKGGITAFMPIYKDYPRHLRYPLPCMLFEVPNADYVRAIKRMESDIKHQGITRS